MGPTRRNERQDLPDLLHAGQAIMLAARWGWRTLIALRRAFGRSRGRVRVTLPRGNLLTLANRRGTVVCCQAGLLWISESGDAADHLVRARQCWRSERGDAVVIHALQPARFTLIQRR